MNRKNILNQAQIKATVTILLEVIKGVLLIMVLGLLFPQVSGKIPFIGFIIGIFCVVFLYYVVIILLKEVKDL